MDIMDVASKIEKKIAESETVRASIRERITKAAETTANYDRAIAVTMIKLSAGQIMQIEQDDGTPIETGRTIASNLDKIAKGICFNQRLEMETAEALLKSALKNLEAILGEMTAYQSIYKHLSNN